MIPPTVRYLFFIGLISVVSIKPANAAPSDPFDLASTDQDSNGLPLNPVWTWQQSHPAQLVDPAICGGRPWLAPCTTQVTWVDNSWKCAANGLLGGHANWMPATYSGTIVWNSHSAPGTDDDYNIDMYRDDLAGLTVNSERSKVLGEAPVLHMEFDSDETIDHFHTEWWNDFHNAVDKSDDAAHQKIDNKYAIAIGLVGLDYAHSGGTELHPLFALAIHSQDDAADDRWAIFVRNWGDEGYCSSGGEHLNAQQISFFVPRPNAIDVQVLPGSSFLFGPDSMSSAEKSQVSGPSVALLRDQGAIVTFTIPGPKSGARINGELRLQWKTGIPASALGSVVGRPAINPAISEIASKWIGASSAAKATVVQPTAVEPEALAAQQISQLTAKQRAAYQSLLPSRPQPIPDSGPLTPRRVTDLTEAPKQAVRPTVSQVPDTAREALEKSKVTALQQARQTPK
jgi:hypothetical protein